MNQPRPAPRAVYAFDARPLTEPVDRAAMKAWRQRRKANGTPDGSRQGCALALLIGFCSLLAAVAASVIPQVLARMEGGGSSHPAAVFAPFLFLVVPGLLVTLIALGIRGKRLLDYRLDRFARANGMEYLPQKADPRLPGLIFHRGSGRLASERVRGTRPRFVEFGNYRYTTGSGKNRTTHRWGYIAIHLDTPLPHIVLDALGNNSVFGSNLPAAFDKDQRLSLEGDFDRHFALYCPRGYERDALYLFTPDIMARFIDHAGQLDVEIVDDWLFLYTRRSVSTLDPHTWAWLFSVVGALIDKLAQWGRWRDERLAPAPAGAPVGPASEALPFPTQPTDARALPPAPPRGVAVQGRRLRRSWSTTAVIVAVVVAAWALVNLVLPVLGALLGR